MKFTRFLAFAALIALVTACGGESSDQQQAAQEESATQQGRTIELIGLNSLKFAVEGEPQGVTVSDILGENDELRRVETISVQPGEEITIELTTRSQMPATAMAHNWVLLALDADTKAFVDAAVKAKANDYIPQDMTDQILAQTGLVAGGQTESVTFTAPETPGEYDYVCTFPAHFAAGMKGKLVVKE